MSQNKFTLPRLFRSCTLVSQNQNPLNIYLNQFTKLLDILKLIQIAWKRNVKQIRLFKMDGTKVEECDLINIKNGSKLIAELSEIQFKPNIIENEYDIMQKIGEGGQGIVYLGKNKMTNQSVALKIMRKSNNMEREQVLKEITILKALDHKNIVKLYQERVIENQNEIIMVMEYLKGGCLLKLANSNLNEKNAKLYLKQIVDAVAYCHKKNIVHCDLKLENIMLQSSVQNDIKIIDFGVSDYVGQLIQTDGVVGTLSYLAPEILLSHQKYIQPSQDVWAVGCIIYGLVFGKLPFDGLDSQETYRNIIKCNYIIPKNNISKDLINLFNQIFINHPKRRINIFGIQQHPWFTEQPQLKLIPLNGNHRKSTSVESLYKSIDENKILVISQKETFHKRRSVSKFDNILAINKIK
ncbi:unnamed protein product [Paramecium sonneborni]|uniref:Protein kinase domain-containing protein n=1 Tax=Paramecium sonneborni TaxID=65129 RepID=A0A8S1M3U4_9CILI|nr:unnamed protein product [Paramecium sonneborni]